MITSNSGIYHTPYSINPNSPSTGSETPTTSTVSRVKRGVANRQALWPQHGTLTIAFMGATQSQKDYVRKVIEDTFSGLINLKLNFVEDTHGDIRISTANDGTGTWSTLGTNALKAPADEPTMHIDFSPSTGDLEANILHEFGHALGLEHEHQHPDRSLDFNTPEAYKYFKNKHNWRQSDTYENFLKKLKPADVITRPYDEKSIMHYPISDEILWKQSEIGLNVSLSEEDKLFLTLLYPPSAPGRGRHRPPRSVRTHN